MAETEIMGIERFNKKRNIGTLDIWKNDNEKLYYSVYYLIQI